MDFLKLFWRGVAVLPGVIEGTEALADKFTAGLNAIIDVVTCLNASTWAKQ